MRNVFRKLINILAPDNIKCIACDAELNQDNKYGLCPKCLAKMPTINKSCHKCGREIYDQGKYCFDCKEGGFYFDRVYSCLNYEDFVHGIVYKLKYGKAKYLAPFIARVIADKIIEEDIKFDFIVPVPLNKNRENQRGFNQAKLIAQEVAKILNCSVVDAISRERDTPFQASLTREQRIENVKDAFVVVDKNMVKGKNILLLDDIFTTGSTINECSKILKNNKAKSVVGITYASAKKKFV